MSSRNASRCVADLLDQVGRDVVGDVVVDRPLRRLRVLGADDRGQRLVVHGDALDRVLCGVPVGGDHHRHGLADVVHLAVGEQVLGPR
jgi:hypothetical protein